MVCLLAMEMAMVKKDIDTKLSKKCDNAYTNCIVEENL